MCLKLSKKVAFISSVISLLIGSFITFYAGNLACSDLSNMFYGVNDIYFVSSIPLFLVSTYFVVIVLFIIRFYRYPEIGKKLILRYSMIMLVISFIALLSTFIGGVFVYGSLLAPYPFNGYFILMLILNASILALMVFIQLFVRKNMDNDTSDKKVKLHYMVNTTILCILIYMSMYRFGSVLWSPFYIHLRTLYLTWPFYVWVSVPMMLVLHIIFYFLDMYKNYLISVIYTGLILLLHLIFGLIVSVHVSLFPEFISAISPALPLERLATSPLDTIIGLVGIALIGGYYLVYSIRSYLKESK